MNIPLTFLGAGLSLLFLMALFCPLEKVFPAKKQPFFRPRWWTDLAFFLGQYLLWSGCVLAILRFFRGWLDLAVPGSFRAAISSQPWRLQAIEVVFLSDLFIYWGHRLQHRVGFLWRFHSIHHSAEHLDWLAAHSNVRLPIGPLRALIGAPELHHWHHSREREAGNYANISPLMDILFGTYRCPAHEPEAFGVSEEMPKTYFGQLLHPFRQSRPGNTADSARPVILPSEP